MLDCSLLTKQAERSIAVLNRADRILSLSMELMRIVQSEWIENDDCFA